jgi:hypothetical protein
MYAISDLLHLSVATSTRLNLTLTEDFCYKTSLVPKGTHILNMYQRNESIQINIAYVLYW